MSIQIDLSIIYTHIAGIKSKEDFEVTAEIIKNKFEKTQKNLPDNLNLHLITSCILVKILEISKNEFLLPKTFLLIEYLIINEMIPKVYYNDVSALYQKNMDLRFGFKVSKLLEAQTKQIVNLKSSFEMNLDSILKPNHYFNANFGYALIDFNGDFIWSNNKSCKLFEFSTSDENLKNFFSALIPFSINQLLKKGHFKKRDHYFIFGVNPKIGESLVFTYLIYSEKNLQKYLKYAKKKGFLEFKENKKKYSKNIIFYKYLKALTSRLTVIALKISKEEYQQNFNKNHYKIFKKEIFEQKLKVEENEEVFYKKMIFLETRFAKSIPKFDFDLMKNDPRIKKFENIVAKKIF